MKCFEFVLALLVLKQLFEHINVTSRYLQSENIDLDAAISSVQATQSILKKFHADGTHFHKLFEAAETRFVTTVWVVKCQVWRVHVAERFLEGLTRCGKMSVDFIIWRKNSKLNSTMKCWIPLSNRLMRDSHKRHNFCCNASASHNLKS